MVNKSIDERNYHHQSILVVAKIKISINLDIYQFIV